MGNHAGFGYHRKRSYIIGPEQWGMTNKGPDLNDLEYTMHAKRSVIKTVRDPYFLDSDPEMILNALLGEIRAVSFGDYLKRAVREKRAADPGEGDDLDYLCAAFKKRGVPPSFTPTTAKLKALAKNWLTQRAVGRNVVLLLGFALEMTPGEVNEFLAKALREPRLDPKDPFEVICWYCYKSRLPYARFAELWAAANEGAGPAGDALLHLDSTVRVRSGMESITTDAELMAYIGRIGLARTNARQSVAARKQFDALYRDVREVTAAMKTEMDRDDAAVAAGRYAEEVLRSDRLYDHEKAEGIGKRRAAYRTWTAGEISPADIEDVLYSAVPKDRSGNMIPMKESLLDLSFWGKRLNRQHIARILEGKDPISRFDIITLCFFAAAGGTDDAGGRRQRYDAFIRRTNRCLKDSDMDPLYAANPYESFVLMCMLTDDPLGSFADVWELSYGAE